MGGESWILIWLSGIGGISRSGFSDHDKEAPLRKIPMVIGGPPMILGIFLLMRIVKGEETFK
jgi:hypothetical protein